MKFLEKKLINLQLFARFQHFLESFPEKSIYQPSFSQKREIILNISHEIALSISFEKREVLSNANNKNLPEFYEVFH